MVFLLPFDGKLLKIIGYILVIFFVVVQFLGNLFLQGWYRINENLVVI